MSTYTVCVVQEMVTTIKVEAKDAFEAMRKIDDIDLDGFNFEFGNVRIAWVTDPEGDEVPGAFTE